MREIKSLRQQIGEPLATIVHIICGVGCTGLYLLFPALAISLGMLFCLIQVVQVWKKGDDGWPELVQFGAGAAITALVIVILRLLGVI